MTVTLPTRSLDSFCLGGERARADALRDRADELTGQLTKAEAAGNALTVEMGELRCQVEAAQMAQAEAEADAVELLQADAARRGRGRLPRLRAAWRGK